MVMLFLLFSVACADTQLPESAPAATFSKAGVPGKVGPEEECLQMLDKASGEERYSLIHKLGQSDNTRVRDIIADILVNDPDPKAREAAAWSFTTCSDPRVVLPLVRAIKDEDAEVRKEAIWHFTNYPDPRALEPLLDALKDPDPGVREHAAHVVQEYKDDRVIPSLIEIFGDSNEHAIVRCVAAIHLPANKDPRAFAPSMAILGDRGQPENVRASAAEILACLGDARATSLLTEAAKEQGDKSLRFWAGIGAVRLQNGAVDDVRLVEAIENYSLSVDGVEMYEDEKSEALRTVARNGSNAAVRSAAKHALTGGKGARVSLSPHQLFQFAMLAVALVLWIVVRRNAARRKTAALARPTAADQQGTANTGQPQRPYASDQPSVHD
jgi:HEAT repeat protein